MARTAKRAATPEPVLPIFYGSKFSVQECEFLLKHLGEPSEVAFAAYDEELPLGVNPAAVASILDTTHRLELLSQTLKERKGESAKGWVGFDRLKRILQDTLTAREEVADLKHRIGRAGGVVRRAASAPSLHFWDPDTDLPYLYGEGSDAGFVRTALTDGGTRRILLYTALQDVGIGSISSLRGVAGFLKGKKENPESEERQVIDAPNALLTSVDGAYGTVRCPICGYVETYEARKTAQKKHAVDEVTKHLQVATVKRREHQLLLKRLRSGRAGRVGMEQRAAAEEPETAEV